MSLGFGHGMACQVGRAGYHARIMKKQLTGLLIVAAALCGFTAAALAQADAGLISKFLDQAKSASDSKLGAIATELTGEMQKLGAGLATNAVVKERLDSTLKALTGGKDSEALTHAFDLVKGAKLTPEQIGVAKQVGNLASAYTVQKHFATLEGSQGDVAMIVSSLRSGNVTAAVPPLKNVATSAKLTDPQKQLITKVADKYAPGWEKAKGAMDGIKKLPGF
jgi:hypothetical protein